MLGAAIRLTPDGPTSRFLVEASPTYRQDMERLPDLDGHWLALQGWLEPLLAFGLVQAGDYDGQFQPDRPITRQEIAVMAVRALGLVGPAENSPAGTARFADWDNISEGTRGYVGAAADAGVLGGYPDGHFRPDRTATRAEAAVIVRRTLGAMSAGLDPQIMVFIRRPTHLYPNETPQAVGLHVPAQMMGSLIYVPARAVYEAAALKLYPGAPLHFAWNPSQQSLAFDYGMPHLFRSGTDTSIFPPDMEQSPPPLPDKARLLFGEVMIPIDTVAGLKPLWAEDPVWEPAAKILLLSIGEPSPQ